MTAGEARGRVALARRALSRALRALSVPRPDWPSARAWLRLAARASASLAGDCDEERGASTMATDDQRREAAERLRGAGVYTLVGKRDDGLTLEWNVVLVSELADAVGLAADGGRAVLDRLADLVESGGGVRCVAELRADARRRGRLARKAAAECVGVDRKTLLALADKIVADTEEGVRSEDIVPAWQAGEALRDVASKIREACGVVA